MDKFYHKVFQSTFSTVLTVAIASVIVAAGVYASTTVGANITTGGNLSVDGNATTSGTLVVGASTWAAPTSTLVISGTAHFTGIATSTDGIWLGLAGAANNINMIGGDLYVQDDAEIDGGLFADSATTTDSFKIGGIFTLGNGETIANVTNNNIYINATGISLATSTATTTNGVWIGAQGGNSTSTLILGSGGSAGQDNTGPKGACIEMWREGLAYRLYINAAGDDVKVEAGRCKD